MSDMNNDDAQYGLLVPFVACASNGGPYDDSSFVAGCYLGKLGLMIEIAALTGTNTVDPGSPVPTPLAPQLDLLAMRHGFTMIATPWDEGPDEWTFVSFTRTQMGPDSQ